MVLRKYYYIDEDFVQDAYASIIGYDLENQEITETSTNGFDGEIKAGSIVKAGIGGEKSNSETVKYSANVTITAKLQRILDYLKEDNENALPYYESMNEETFSLLNRDDLFEGVFNIQFTKVEEYSQIASMTQRFYQLLNLGLTDNYIELEQIQAIAKKEREKGIACLLSFANDNKQTCYMYLDESFLRTDISKLKGEATVICKVSRTIPKGKTVNLTDLTELTKFKMPNTNTRKGRTQKVQQIKNGNNKNYI